THEPCAEGTAGNSRQREILSGSVHSDARLVLEDTGDKISGNERDAWVTLSFCSNKNPFILLHFTDSVYPSLSHSLNHSITHSITQSLSLCPSFSPSLSLSLSLSPSLTHLKTQAHTLSPIAPHLPFL